MRRIQPISEMRRVFEVACSEIDAIDRGAKDPGLDPVVDAVRDLALAEDSAVFNGLPEAGIDGICTSSAHETLKISKA